MSDKLPHAWMHKKQEMSSSELRKANKPLMEKKRRARINSSLTQLKSLVLEATKKDTSRYSKLEKADILEMTVKHLRSVQRQQLAEAMAVDNSVVHKYRAGFSECAGEVNRYMRSIDGLDPKVRDRLIGHLSGCVHKINTVVNPANQYHSNAGPQQLPGNPPVTFTAVTNHQAASIMSPLQVQIPLGMMNQHSLPTPPASAEMTQGSHPPAGQHSLGYQQGPPRNTGFTQMDVMACHLQMALIAQSSNLGGASRMNEHVYGYPGNHPDQGVSFTQRGCRGNMSQHHGYYGNMSSSMVTPRHSTSTPSPSQQSLSPPPRCESVDSNLSVLSGASGSPVPLAQFNTFQPISATRGSCSATPMQQQAPSAHYNELREPQAAYSVGRDSRYEHDHSNGIRYLDDDKTCASPDFAVDLSRPNPRRFCDDVSCKQMLDVNHNEIHIQQPAAHPQQPAANAEPVWRPW